MEKPVQSPTTRKILKCFFSLFLKIFSKEQNTSSLSIMSWPSSQHWKAKKNLSNLDHAFSDCYLKLKTEHVIFLARSKPLLCLLPFYDCRWETMEKAMKDLKIGPKMLAKRSYAIWNILLATEEEAKQLAGIIHGKSSTSPDRIHGHPIDNSDCTWGDRRYHRGLVGGFFLRNMDRSEMFLR